MKVFLSAIACHPEHGSEGGLGWKAATALSKKHQVHVLTFTSMRTAVERALASGDYPSLTFSYFGKDAPYHQNRLIARLQSWTRYLAWTQQSLEIVLARSLSAMEAGPALCLGPRRGCRRVSQTFAHQTGSALSAFRVGARNVQSACLPFQSTQGLRAQLDCCSRLEQRNL